MSITVVPDLGESGWRDNLFADYPESWTGDEAKLPGGGQYAIFTALAANLEILNQQAVYAFNATRIGTATDAALDLCSVDYFGDMLPRRIDETDESYRERILATLLEEKVTERGIRDIITRLTGFEPRMIQPWDANDTGGYDHAYYDVDSKTIPGIYGDGSMRYQAAIIAKLPQVAIEGAAPVWGYDKGAAYDAYTAVYWILVAKNFITISQLYAAIIGAKAMGITIWLKIDYGQIDFILSSSYSIASGSTNLNVAVQLLQSPYCVLVSTSWMSASWARNFQPNSYDIGFSTPAPSGNVLNLAAIPYSVPGSGSLPVTTGDTDITIDIPSNAGSNRVMVTPTWASTVWISAFTDTTVTFSFGAPAPVGGSISTYWFPNAQSQFVTIAEASTATNLFAPAGSVPFVLPSWNTQVRVKLTNTVLFVEFSVPAPADSFIHVGYTGSV